MSNYNQWQPSVIGGRFTAFLVLYQIIIFNSKHTKQKKNKFRWWLELSREEHTLVQSFPLTSLLSSLQSHYRWWGHPGKQSHLLVILSMCVVLIAWKANHISHHLRTKTQLCLTKRVRFVVFCSVYIIILSASTLHALKWNVHYSLQVKTMGLESCSFPIFVKKNQPLPLDWPSVL